MVFQIAIEDPRSSDVAALLEAHLDHARQTSPPGHVHALDLDGLQAPSVSFFGARVDGRLLGVGAIKQLDGQHGEVKSMHTLSSARRSGVGRAMIEHLLEIARGRGLRRVSLETGTMDGFAAARALYESVGFVPCPPFGSYTSNRHSMCLTIELDAATGSAAERDGG